MNRQLEIPAKFDRNPSYTFRCTWEMKKYSPPPAAGLGLGAELLPSGLHLQLNSNNAAILCCCGNPIKCSTYKTVGILLCPLCVGFAESQASRLAVVLPTHSVQKSYEMEEINTN